MRHFLLPLLTILTLCSSTIYAKKPHQVGTFEMKKRRLDQQPLRQLGKSGQCTEKIRALLLTDNSFSESEAFSRGWKITARTKSIVTVLGCTEDIPGLVSLKGVLDVKLPGPLQENLDQVRELTGINYLQAGPPLSSLSQPFTGKGVLVGIIDSEFDIHHPAFLDSNGRTRFIALWDQTTGTESGIVKTGDELDSDTTFGLTPGRLHGTHVASVAAGGRTDVPYHGIAPEAMLAAVKYGQGDTYLSEAIQWIFSLADSLSVPCVINISLGSHDGPHDGSSTLDRLIDTISGPGRIIVGSAGNDGTNKVHLGLTLSRSDSTGSFSIPRLSGDMYISGLDIWGIERNYYSANIYIIDTVTLQYLKSTSSYSTSSTGNYMPDTIPFENTTTGETDTVIVAGIHERSSALNRRPHMKFLLKSKKGHYALGMRFWGSGSLNMWSLASAQLKSFDVGGMIDGDNVMSISEVGGTAREIITVGAYQSKNSQVMWNGEEAYRSDELYTLASWSSRGPTLDGRIKPDLTAPGSFVVGAASQASDLSDIVVWPDQASKKGRYTFLGGTSISAPVVTGIVALLLEADPQLSPIEIKELLSTTVIKDQFTGDVLPDNNWGAGKVDAKAALEELLQISVSTLTRQNGFKPAHVLSFAGGNRIKIQAAGRDPVILRGSDIRGRTLFKVKLPAHSQFSLPPTTARGPLMLRLEREGKVLGRAKAVVY